MDKCTQCNKCSLICPHAAVRPFLMTNQELGKAPAAFKDGSRAAIGGGVLDNYQYRIQVSPWDCTGCELCVRICPADALSLKPAAEMIQQEEPNWNFAITLPDRGEEIDKTTAFKQRRDYLAMQVEAALTDESVPMSEELRQALKQYLVMRQEQMHDLLLPRGRSIYHQIMEKLVPLLEKDRHAHPKIKALYDLLLSCMT
ncbi:PFOR, partial [Symbiodinium pilosum]